MVKTLADMTPEERAQCRGLWCDYLTVNGDVIQVIYRWEKDGIASVHDPKTLDERTNQYVMVRSLTPRFDLMRAWNPDGTPVKMSMEWGLSYSTSYDNYQEREIRLTGDDEDKIRRNLDNLRELERNRDSVRDVQLHTRHVTEWEATDE